MRFNRPKSEPIDPRLQMPRGSTDFEEKWIKTDFLAVFGQIANASMNSIQDTHEYAYRAGFVAGKSRRELSEMTIEGRKLPSYIKIL